MGGIIDGIFFQSGAVDDSPLSTFLTKLGSPLLPPKRKYVVSSGDVNSGAYVRFTEANYTSKEMLVKEVVSSSSIPFVFPNQKWPGTDHPVMMDGGTMYNVNLVSAVQRCRENVDQDSKITIDIAVCDSHHLSNWTDSGNAIGNYLRRSNIKSYQESMEDIYSFKRAFPEVHFRYFVAPSEPLKDGIGMLDFTNSTTTWHSQLVGRKDGATAV
jgi:predicted acylesterase/phospholipase RssA